MELEETIGSKDFYEETNTTIKLRNGERIIVDSDSVVLADNGIKITRYILASEIKSISWDYKLSSTEE